MDLKNVESLIEKLETQQKVDNENVSTKFLTPVEAPFQKLNLNSNSAGNDSSAFVNHSNFTTYPSSSFWHQMSPQLSFIDGSSVNSSFNSFGPSFENFLENQDENRNIDKFGKYPTDHFFEKIIEPTRDFRKCQNPDDLNIFDYKSELNNKSNFPSLPSLTAPLAKPISSSNAILDKPYSLINHSEGNILEKSTEKKNLVDPFEDINQCAGSILGKDTEQYSYNYCGLINRSVGEIMENAFSNRPSISENGSNVSNCTDNSFFKPYSDSNLSGKELHLSLKDTNADFSTVEVSVERNAFIKTKIKKLLSFADTVDLHTTPTTCTKFSSRNFIQTHAGSFTENCAKKNIERNHEIGQIQNNTSKKFQNTDISEIKNLDHQSQVQSLIRAESTDCQSQYSLYMDKDLRYYFQHPWFRLFVAYFVIFCNFLLFAEDPVSHSHAESDIPVVGNVFSFVVTKYPIEWYWRMVKVIMWLIALFCGMLVGKIIIHGIVLKRLFRLKMFRDDQGSWMTMMLTVIVSLYMFSHVYNLVLLMGHPNYWIWQINSQMWITNENMMKAAATCTWLGDLITALMVTDMMLQDNLYPYWGTKFRRLYRLSNVPRILIFWVGSIVVAIIVIFLIVSDYISWDKLNKGFVETTELSRAFLASFILVMDLLIVMQDWDFPHFTNTIDVNLPGFSTHTLHWRYAETKVTGKWFNYGIIFLVMIFDLNMWKNQIFYAPQNYGQYIDPVSRKVFTVEDESVLSTQNSTLWTWHGRGEIDPNTGDPFRDNDMFMYSRYMGYKLEVKCTAFIPNILGFIMLFTLLSLYGRFPPNEDGTYGGRVKKRERSSSWRRERRCVLPLESRQEEKQGKINSRSGTKALRKSGKKMHV